MSFRAMFQFASLQPNQAMLLALLLLLALAALVLSAICADCPEKEQSSKTSKTQRSTKRSVKSSLRNAPPSKNSFSMKQIISGKSLAVASAKSSSSSTQQTSNGARPKLKCMEKNSGIDAASAVRSQESGTSLVRVEPTKTAKFLDSDLVSVIPAPDENLGI